MTGNGQPEPSRATRWLLWLTLLHTLPAPFFLFVVIGTVPAAGLLAAGVAGLFAGDREGLAMGAVLGAQGAGYATLYFLVAWLLEFLLRRLRAVALRSLVLAILVAAMFAATLAPIYGSGGHGAERWTNLPGLLSEFAAPPVGPWLAPYFGALGLVLAGLLVLQAVAIPPVLQRLADRWPPLPVQIGLLALLVGSLALYSNRVVVFCMPAAQADQVWAQLCIARAARERAEAGRYADAESWYARAAEQGSRTAMRELLEITRSPDVRRRWLAVLAAEGDAGARVAWWELVRNDAAADRSTALAWLTEAAGDGHPRAALELARHLIDAGEPASGRTWLEAAAGADQGDALRELAWRYEQGAPGFPIDLERAAALYAQLAEGIDQGRHETRMYTQTASGYREQAHGIRALLQAADSGDRTAQARLGERILDSRNPDRRGIQAAVGWLEKAAAQNDPGAQHLLGQLFVTGRDGVDKDLPRGRQWWDRAAALGHVPTLRYVADARVSGRYGYPIDFARARDEFAILAEAFSSGSHGVEADPRQAQHWRSALRDVERKIADLGPDYRPMDELREHAQAGDPQAQYQLGAQLVQAYSTDAHQEAVDWWIRAARGGNHEAQFRLISYYDRGDRFVPRDHARVVGLLQQAAAGKHPQAMWTLGLAYEKGRYGLAPDLRKAGELYREILAAQAGDPYGWRQEERFYSMVRVRIGAVERMQAMAAAP